MIVAIHCSRHDSGNINRIGGGGGVGRSCSGRQISTGAEAGPLSRPANSTPPTGSLWTTASAWLYSYSWSACRPLNG